MASIGTDNSVVGGGPKEQMPGRLGRFDDPYGITWRVVNLIKRVNLRRLTRFFEGYVRFVQYKRPVFIIGVPRSGTTSLFRLLGAGSQLGSLHREGHDVWRMYHHPRRRGWKSDAVGAGLLGVGERRFVNAFFYAYVGRRRFVEKTPENSLRIPYLLDLFPDAVFIVIKRNPCDVVNSLINGWRHPAGRFRSYYVPQDLSIPGYAQRRRWCFALIESWREYVSAPVPEIALAQWAACTQSIVQSRRQVDDSRWFEFFFEDWLADPAGTAKLIYEAAGIEEEPALAAALEALMKNPANALTAPGEDKWRKQNREEIELLLPRIAVAARQAGYIVDPKTGDCEISR